MRVTEDLEVVVDGVANHHLPHEQLHDLLLGLGEWRGVGEVSWSYAAPSGAVVSHRHGGFDEFVVNHISFIGHDAAARQLTDAAFWSRTHHLTVHSEVLCGVSG